MNDGSIIDKKKRREYLQAVQRRAGRFRRFGSGEGKGAGLSSCKKQEGKKEGPLREAAGREERVKCRDHEREKKKGSQLSLP